MAKLKQKLDYKITVRAHLFVECRGTSPNIAGSRLIKGKGCPVTKFDFDDFGMATVAARKLEKYLNSEQFDD